MSCLFNSISKWTSESSDVVRQKVCDYMDKHSDRGFDDIPLVQMLDTYNESLSKMEKKRSVLAYITNMRKSSTWGGAIEIRAAAEVYGRRIVVFSIRKSDNPLFTNGLVFSPSSFASNDEEDIKISWNGFHYEPLPLKKKRQGTRSPV